MELKGIKGGLTVERFQLSDDFLILDENGYQIAIVENEYIMDVEKTQANALLISKAPEMLEMLKEVYTMQEEGDGNCKHLRKRVLKLIKEATEI